MEPPFATGEELRAFTQRSEVPASADLILDLASGAVLNEGPKIADIDSETDGVSSRVVKLVTLQLAARLLANPDFVSSESSGNASTSYRDVEQYLTDAEKDLLGGWKTQSKGGSVQLRTSHA